MRWKSNLFLFSLMLVVICGCVPKTEFDTLNGEYLLARKQLMTEKSKIKQLEKQLCELQKENEKIAGQIEGLTTLIKEKKHLISVQGKIIKFLDDPSQTLQKSIEEQIADQK